MFPAQQGAPVVAAGNNGNNGSMGSPAISLGLAQSWQQQQQQPQHMPAQTTPAHSSAGLTGMRASVTASPLPFTPGVIANDLRQDMLSPGQPFREPWLQGIDPITISQLHSTAYYAGNPYKLHSAQAAPRSATALPAAPRQRSAVTATANSHSARTAPDKNNSARAAPSQQVGPSTSRQTRKRNRPSRFDDQENMDPGMCHWRVQTQQCI